MPRRLSKTAERLYRALEDAPTGVPVEAMPEMYPELVVQVHRAVRELHSKGLIQYRFRRWTVVKKPG